jgi:hypothetical protein
MIGSGSRQHSASDEVNVDRDIEYRYLRREVELLSGLGSEIVAHFRVAHREGRDAEVAELVRPLVRVAIRLSHLLWPVGSWATDAGSVAAAEAIRRELKLHGDQPISPARIISFTAVIAMSPSELRHAVDPQHGVLRVGQREYALDPLFSSLVEIGRRLFPTADAA